jgi:hypothetical protein
VRRLAAILLLMAWLVAGCSMFAEAAPVPQPCGQVYGTQRCLAMTDEAASRIDRTRDDVARTEIVPDPPPPDGILQTLGGAASITVRVRFTDGSSTDARMCGGIPSGPACTDSPQLEARSSIQEGGGYHDVPCPDGSPPHTCGTPLPTLQPAAVAGARSLSVARFEIPIDRRGPYEVPLGEVLLPNGIATAASFEFADAWPLDVSLGQGVAQIDLRSLEPDGKPFQNYFDHGWRPGVERVEAVLSFEVLWFEKGAVLGIRDVVVR